MLQQVNGKVQQITAQAQQLEAMLRDRTIDQLFNVVKYSSCFDSSFVTACTDAIEKYLTQVALTEPEQPQTTDVTPVTE